MLSDNVTDSFYIYFILYVTVVSANWWVNSEHLKEVVTGIYCRCSHSMQSEHIAERISKRYETK